MVLEVNNGHCVKFPWIWSAFLMLCLKVLYGLEDRTICVNYRVATTLVYMTKHSHCGGLLTCL